MLNKPIKTNRDTAFNAVPELKEVIKSPYIALPTILLFFFVLIFWILSTTAGISHLLPIWLCVLVNATLAYLSFTVLHDAAHHAVSQKNWINESLGWVSLLILGPLTFSFKTFRFIHIQHHRFTNEPKNDPDYWVSIGPRWLRPVMLATIDINYMFYYLPQLFTRPRSEIISLLIHSLLMISLVTILIISGHGLDMLWYWIIPSRIALFLLALGLDYLPHHPHKITDKENPYEATSIREGAGFFWSPILMYQNYHLAHHLYPTAPFYRYKKVWEVGHSYFMTKKPFIIDALGKRKQT